MLGGFEGKPQGCRDYDFRADNQHQSFSVFAGIGFSRRLLKLCLIEAPHYRSPTEIDFSGRRTADHYRPAS